MVKRAVAALDFVACQSKNAANIHNRWLSCRRQRSLRPPHGQYKIVLEEGEHIGAIKTLLMFALFEDVFVFILTAQPQVTFASLSSPAVMDVRRLWRRQATKSSVATVSAKRLRAYGAQEC